MSRMPSISAATCARLQNPTPPGQRHHEAVKTASSLIAGGFSPDQAFAVIRGSYEPDFPDSEIRSIICWAVKKLPAAPRQFAGDYRFPRQISRLSWRPPESRPPAIPPENAVLTFLNGFSCEDVDLWEASPVRLLDRFIADAEMLIGTLYSAGEMVNIVSDYSCDGDKARPRGVGITQTRENCLARFRKNGPPNSPAGTWIRLNPTDGKGISDRNVTHFRFALLELDSIPLALQIPFIARLRLPISAIITSGGKSLHAWIRIGANSAAEFREVVSQVFALTIPFGVDSANSNPSRLGRLPGVFRRIGGSEDNRQRLLYLNPSPTCRRIIE